MRIRLCLAVVVLVLLVPFASRAQEAAQQAAIRHTLDTQVAAWNRGDIPAFMQGYEDSPKTTFVGSTIEHGWAMILARYQRTYSSAAQMGRLEFTGLDIRPLGADYAVVTGHFHLTRAAAGGGDASGIFSLVFEKTSGGWKIILDHTS